MEQNRKEVDKEIDSMLGKNELSRLHIRFNLYIIAKYYMKFPRKDLHESFLKEESKKRKTRKSVYEFVGMNRTTFHNYRKIIDYGGKLREDLIDKYEGYGLNREFFEDLRNDDTDIKNRLLINRIYDKNGIAYMLKIEDIIHFIDEDEEVYTVGAKTSNNNGAEKRLDIINGINEEISKAVNNSKYNRKLENLYYYCHAGTENKRYSRIINEVRDIMIKMERISVADWIEYNSAEIQGKLDYDSQKCLNIIKDNYEALSSIITIQTKINALKKDMK